MHRSGRSIRRRLTCGHRACLAHSVKFTINIILFTAMLTLLPLSGEAGSLHPPKYSIGAEFGQSFVGVSVYEDNTEFRVGSEWYRLQIPATRVERLAIGSGAILFLLTLGVAGFTFRGRKARRNALSTPFGKA